MSAFEFVLTYIVLPLGVMFVGAFLWEEYIRDWFGNAKSYLSSKYMHSKAASRGKLYKSVAQGHHELPSLILMAASIMLICGVIVFFMANDFRDIFLEKDSIASEEMIKAKEAVAKFEIAKKLQDVKKMKVEVIKLKAIKSKLNDKLKYSYIILISILLIAVFFVLKEFFRLNLVNLLVTYQRQCFLICRPYMTNKDALLIESKIASMSTEQDYNTIFEGFLSICSSNKITLPSPPFGLGVPAKFEKQIES